MNLRQHSLLNFGFDLTYRNQSFELDLSFVEKKKYKGYSEADLVKVGSQIFRDVIDELYNNSDMKSVVPISGGLDSRAILAALLEIIPANKIKTYTFGIPGTYDYDIGNLVAKKLGTNHISFNLNSYSYSIDELKDIAKRINYQTVLFHHPPIWMLDELFQGMDIWSGFFGGESTGAHLLNLNLSVTGYMNMFLQKHLYAKEIISDISFDDFYEYISPPSSYLEKGISMYESLDFFNRQAKFIEPHVLLKGFNYITPFTHKKWLGFILSIDQKYRINQRLFKKMLLEMFPEAFKIKTKSMLALPLSVSRFRYNSKRTLNKIKTLTNKFFPIFKNRNINYIDFNKDFLKREDTMEILSIIKHDLGFKKEHPHLYKTMFDEDWKKLDSKTAVLCISMYFNTFLYKTD